MTRSESRARAPRWRLSISGCLVALLAASASAQEAPRTTPVPSYLRLGDAIRIALEGSNQVGIQEAQLDVAQKEHRAAWWNLGPDLNVGATWAGSTRKDFDVTYDEPSRFGTLQTLEGDRLRTPVEYTERTEDVTEESRYDNYDVSARIRLFDGLANYARIAAAGHDVRTQTHSTEYTRQIVTETVIEAYFNHLRGKLLLDVAEEAVKVAQEQLDRTKALYELGSAARSDVLKQQVQLGNTRLDYVKADQYVKQTFVDLVWAMNLDSTTAFEIDTTVSRVQFKTTTFEAERDYALRNRENLLSFRAREAAEDRRIWVARGPLFPTLDFQYSLGYTKTTSQFRFGAAENSDRQWVLLANWNLWDRYAKYANLSRAKASARIATYDRRQAELDAVREVKRLVNTMDEAKERLGVSRENVASASEDLRLASEKFRVGAGTILDTIEAESNLTRASANEVQAIVDYLIARAKLARATGRPIDQV